jgi:uncharacterized protein (DUF736 family)
MATTNTTNTTTTPAKNAWDKKELGALWKRETQSSKEKYLTGVINLKSLGFDKDVSIIIFSNKNKQKESHPDLRVYLSEKRESKTETKKPVEATVAVPVTTDNDLI